MNKQEEKILSGMFKELKKSPVLYQPSIFWDELNKIHLEYLSKDGFDNFKRTVNTKYFNWGTLGIIVHQLSPIFKEFLRGNIAPLIESKFEDKRLNLRQSVKKLNYFEELTCRIYLASLFEYISRCDSLKILQRIEEPLIGNPFVVRYKGKLISQDLYNSVYEFYSITQNLKLPKKIKVAELGAGYGRVGYVILKTLPDSAYCVIDIPPALFIAQNYLSKVFSKQKIFKFRPFTSFKKVKQEFKQSRIQFLMPHQIELLPKKYFDLFLNISSLHEMTREQIGNYIKQIDRLCQGYFYTKQWRKSHTKDNEFIKESEYPIPRTWKVIYKRDRHPIQSMFFDALYKIRF